MSSAEHKRKRSQAKTVGDMVSSESISATYSHRAGVWSEAEDELLYSWQRRIGNKWSEVARHIPGKTGQQCAQRWRHKVNPDIRRDKWTAEEDSLLVRLVHQFGNRWALISRNVPGRTDQQCMGRWKRHLDPNIKRAGWSLEEDINLCALYFRYRTQWSDISRGLDGRTPQQCRTRWQNLNQSQFVRTYQHEIDRVDIEAVERAQMAINLQRESVTGLPTATTRARMPGKNKKVPGRRKAVAGGSTTGDNAGYYRAPANDSNRSAAAAAMLMDVGRNLHPAAYHGSLNTLQYPPSMLPTRFAAHPPHAPHAISDGWDQASKRRREGSFERELVTHDRRGAGHFTQPVPSAAGRAPRSDGRLRRSAFDETVGELAAVDKAWHSGDIDIPRGHSAPVYSHDPHGIYHQANRSAPPQDDVEDGMMLPVNRLHQHMTPLKPEAVGGGCGSGGSGGGGTGSVGSGHKNGQGSVKDEHGSLMGHQHLTAGHPRQCYVENKDYYRDTGSFLGLEYLADDKIPGNKTPLSALKHAKTAISPMLADLLCSPLIGKDQMRGMQSMQALLASPPGVINRGSNPNSTPERGRLTSDVVRCLDLSEAVTSSIGSLSGSKLPGANADGQVNPIVGENVPHAFAAVYTPDHIGSRHPLVLDSIGRMGASSVMMRNSLSADAEQFHSSMYDKLGVNRQAFVQMPVYNDAEGFALGTASAGTRYAAPSARQILASHDGTAGNEALPGGFRQPSGNDKAGSKRRLSIDNVRMSLHALLDKA